MNLSRHCILLFLLVAVGLSGCRTYGRYGAKDKAVAKIAQITEDFQRGHERAQVDLESFRKAATAVPALEPYAVRYGEIVRRHGEVATEHAKQFKQLSGGLFAYSAAKRLLGAMVSEQNLIADDYSEVVAEAALALGIHIRNDPRPTDNYVQVPPFYERLRFEIVSPSLNTVLQAAGM